VESFAAPAGFSGPQAFCARNKGSPINHFGAGTAVALTSAATGLSMISSIAHTGIYYRSAPAQPSTKTLTAADALPPSDADAGKAPGNAKHGIPVSELKQIDTSKLKPISIAELPELRDQMATHWLNMRAAEARMATEVPDNAPQNTYATVKVNGKVVATLYNSGGAAMTNAAAAAVGDLQDPPGLNGGPDLAQARAERIAKALGGTIEKASTAIKQSQWTPRPDISTNYSRTQLDDAWQAMLAENQRATAQQSAGYSATQPPIGSRADFNA
jgi:hypothetical protein